ncbi:MAG TPA: GNAT family N-acetyltransferase [Candidatus Lokiarchaeia archaeon]|nr:GNAT family N-acetyltransferase [Candidatus Lokiarchaeia archaeon]
MKHDEPSTSDADSMIEKRVQQRVTSIQQRVRRLKMSRVVEIAPDEITEESPGFRFIIMKLPISKISEEKLAEMAAKSRMVRQTAKFRTAEEKDVPGLCDLYNLAFFQAPDPYRPVTLNDMQTILEKSTILIVNLYGLDGGFIVMKLETTETDAEISERSGVICGIAVHPRYRQRGLATAIGLEAWQSFFKTKELDYLECEVYEKNGPSLSFISWVGFRPVGELVVKAPSAAQINPLDFV